VAMALTSFGSNRRPETSNQIWLLVAGYWFPPQRFSALKLESCLPGGFSQRLHAPMVAVAPTVKNDLADPAFCSFRSEHFAEQLCRSNIAAISTRVLGLEGLRGTAKQRLVVQIIDHLHVEVFVAAKHRHPRAVWKSDDSFADPAMTSGSSSLPSDHPPTCLLAEGEPT